MAEELGRAGLGGAGEADTVTAPDQHKPTNIRLIRVGGIAAIIVLLLMTSPFNNHTGWVEDAYLLGIAGLIALLLVVDAVLRRNGLRR